MSRDYLAIAAQYQADILDGTIPASAWVQRACARNRRDLDRQNTPGFPFHFDPALAVRICRFAELLPYVTGRGFAEVVARDEQDMPIWRTLVLQPWQCWLFTTLYGWANTKGLRRFRVALILVPRKNAKALALDTEIPTPDGFRLMRDLHPGDVVFGADGKPTTVIAESPVIVGQTCYEVEFSTGERIVADAGHLWKTTARVNDPGTAAQYPRRRARYEQVRTTEQIAGTVRYGRRHDRNHSVMVAAALELPDASFTIDPYVLGVWLGDGNSAGGAFTNADPEVVAAVEAAEGEVRMYARRGLAASYRIGRSYRDGQPAAATFQGRLRALGVLGNKHIPEDYLRASRAQRLALLQGLMDTDGTASKAGQLIFVSTSTRLADDVFQLIASLGLKPSRHSRDAKLYGRIVGTAHAVQFWAGDVPVFRITRKLARQRPSGQTARSTTRQIVAVREVPSVPVKCITVESPGHMFLVGRSCIPTHNSTMGAIMALFGLTEEGEPGALCISAATTREQAKAVADIAWEMAKRSPLFREYYGVRLGSETSRSLTVPTTASKFLPLSADANSLDGLNISLAIVDELHAHKTAAVWNVIDTATGARLQPLIVGISTAGVDLGGICHQKLGYLEKVLDGVAIDAAFFGIVYGIDPGDDIRQPAVQQKANPSYGVSVQADDLVRKIAEAQHSPAALNNILTKHFNVWIRSESAWMPGTLWQTCAVQGCTIERLKGFPCWIGVDLAEVRDIAALVAVFQIAVDAYAVIGRFYLPKAAIDRSPVAQISGWVHEGHVIETDGDQADFGRIQADLVRWCDVLQQVKEIDFDRALAAQMQQELKRVLEPRMGRDAVDRFVVTVPQTVETMDPAMKMTERLVLSKTLQHSGNPAMAWMISNVVIERNYKDEIYPRKAGGKDSPNKIDGPVAMWTALSRAMAAPVRQPEYQMLVLGGPK